MAQCQTRGRVSEGICLHGRVENWPGAVFHHLQEGDRPHQSLAFKTPDVVYRTGKGGGAEIEDKYPREPEESPIPLRSTEDSSGSNHRSAPPAKTPTGQRHATAIEPECATETQGIFVLTKGSTLHLSSSIFMSRSGSFLVSAQGMPPGTRSFRPETRFSGDVSSGLLYYLLVTQGRAEHPWDRIITSTTTRP